MEENYFCKIASLEEMHQRWDDEIARHAEKRNWIVWKDEAIAHFRAGTSLPYYGILDGQIICEATAVLRPGFAQPGGEKAVELCAFRTVPEHRGDGYFSKLMDFLQRDLREKGYTLAVVGVEPHEARNKAIYRHWGFTALLCTGSETYPDGTVIAVEYYAKPLPLDKTGSVAL